MTAASTWEVKSLGELAEIQSGGTPSTKERVYWDGGDVHWVTLVDTKEKYLRATQKKITQLGMEKSSAKLLPINTVLFSSRATIGYVSIAKVETCTNQGYKNFICDETKLHHEFLYYVLKHKSADIAKLGAGTIYPEVSKTIFSHYKIPFPPLAEQKRIAGILGALDDKIEINRQTNQTLEKIAQAIFQSWFIDFAPTKAKAAAKKTNATPAQITRAAVRTLTGKTDSQINQLPPKTQKQLTTTAALFPDSMQNTKLGKIPTGWEVSTLGEHFDVVMGQSPKGDTYNENGLGMPFFQGSRDFGWRFPTIRVYTTDPKQFANPGDTLISVRAPVGDKNMAMIKCCLGRGVAAIRHKSGAKSFTYAFITHIEKKLSERGSAGTVFASINQSQLKSVPFIASADKLVSLFEEQIRPFDDKILTLSKENRTLANFRDILLPRLICGKLSTS